MKDLLIFVMFYGTFTTAMYQLTHHESIKKPTVSGEPSANHCVNSDSNIKTTSREVI